MTFLEALATVYKKPVNAALDDVELMLKRGEINREVYVMLCYNLAEVDLHQGYDSNTCCDHAS